MRLAAFEDERGGLNNTSRYLIYNNYYPVQSSGDPISTMVWRKDWLHHANKIHATAGPGPFMTKTGNKENPSVPKKDSQLRSKLQY